jgi:hypothetical protein
MTNWPTNYTFSASFALLIRSLDWFVAATGENRNTWSKMQKMKIIKPLLYKNQTLIWCNYVHSVGQGRPKMTFDLALSLFVLSARQWYVSSHAVLKVKSVGRSKRAPVLCISINCHLNWWENRFECNLIKFFFVLPVISGTGQIKQRARERERLAPAR